MKQHIVPKCYLKAWCDPKTPKAHEPYIWLISKDGTEKTKKSPQKSLKGADAYMIRFPDGKTDQIVETTLSQLEGHFVRLLRKIVELKKLDGFDRAHLAMFMMAMHSRTDSAAAAMETSMNRLHEIVGDLEDAIKQGTAPPPMRSIHQDGKERGTPITSVDTEFLRKNVRPNNVMFSLELAPLLASGLSLRHRYHAGIRLRTSEYFH